MSVRDSSIEAYDEIVSSGKGATQKGRLLDYMIHLWPNTMTRRELASVTGIEVSAISGRINALVKDGYLKEIGKRKCKITGKNVYELQAVLTEQDRQGKLF